jgi:O-antigen chain-terminating methyltransferase
MESTSRFVSLAIERPAGRAPVRTVRRALYRLLYPLLQQQTDHAEATARLVTQLASRVNVLERRAADDDDRGEPGVGGLSMLDLERAFRSSEDVIRERQQQYVELYIGRAPVLDVGCGRGEFLALLREQGITAAGVDHDIDMVEHCRALGLDVLRADALTHLQSLEPRSLGGIFSAQVIEHLPPGAVVSLVSHAARVLRPQGMLLLETVNPRSFAALAGFYTDLTHVRPYEMGGIVHLLASSGFVDIGTRVLFPHGSHDALTSALEVALGPDERTRAIAADVADKLYGPQAFAVWGYRRGL